MFSDANRAREDAEASKKEADVSMEQANLAKERADKAKETADIAEREAEEIEKRQAAFDEVSRSGGAEEEPLRESREARSIAEEARKEAETARNAAEEARGRAESARNEAEFTRGHAEIERDVCAEAKKLAEEALQQANAAVDQANIAQAKAETASQRKSQALANMAHELRTPLNAVIGYSEMLAQGTVGALNEKQVHYAQNIATSGHHLLAMINDILDLSKIEAGKLKLTPESIDLQTFIAEINNLATILAEKKNIQVTLEAQPNLPVIEADLDRLRQIFYNLLSNAIKFNRAGGNVRIRLFPDEDTGCLVTQVQDTGIGIPEDKLQYLFSEYYQVGEPFLEKQEGTGLGLALTKRLVELHQGSIAVESQEGKGTTFTVKLPLKAS